MRLHNYKGTEFEKGQTAMLDWGGKTGKLPCKVLHWSTAYGGWWYVKLTNGAFHYTQRLVIE